VAGRFGLDKAAEHTQCGSELDTQLDIPRLQRDTALERRESALLLALHHQRIASVPKARA